jgi:AraC-like DNA-binding protein
MAGRAALHRVFEQERVPIALIENREMRLPLWALSALIERGSHEAGERIFGARVGETMSPVNYGLWAEYGRSGRNLAVGLRRVIATIACHQIGSRMSLRWTNAHVVWEFHPQTAVGMQYADHIIGPMRHFVSAYLGLSWIPAWIQLTYPKDSDAGALSRYWKTEVRFAQASIGIAIPRDRLHAPKGQTARSERQLTTVELVAQSNQRRALNPVHAIEDIVALRLMDGEFDIDGAARLAGTSIRSLQRLLGERAGSYRQLLDNARCRRAKALLLETETPITEIAMALGYSEPGNFTRAFVRWSGNSPSTVRKQTKRGCSAG